MTIKIVKDEKYENKVKPQNIHGLYPYKLYLEVLGNSNIGKYIVVVSDKQLNKKGEVDEIVIKIKNEHKRRKRSENNIIQPNILNNGYGLRYRVKEVSILNVGNTEIDVYKPEK